MAGTSVKNNIGVEDLNIGVGTFNRRTSAGDSIVLTKISSIGDRGTAPPTTGEWLRGQIRWNTAPELGGNMGWVCTTAGTPGVWAEFGFISANPA